MAWRVPRFSFLNVGRDVGVAGITTLNAVNPNFPLAFLIDGRQSDPMTFLLPQTDHYIEIDRGTGTLAGVDRFVLGANHNYDGNNVRLRADDTGTFVTPTTLVPETAVTGSGMLDFGFLPNIERFVRLDWPNSASTAWETTEFFLSNTLATTIGPQDGWEDEPIFAGEQYQKLSGVTAYLETGPSRRSFQFIYRAAGFPTQTDNDVLEALIETVGISKPFIFDPPFDDEPALFCVLGEIGRRFDFEAPAQGTKAYRYQLPIIEVIS